jgi:hypothetical protein
MHMIDKAQGNLAVCRSLTSLRCRLLLHRALGPHCGAECSMVIGSKANYIRGNRWRCAFEQISYFRRNLYIGGDAFAVA